MTLKRRTLFYSLLAVMLLAAVYSPSTLSFGAQSSPASDSQGYGLTDFLSYLHASGHSVVLANTSADMLSAIQRPGATLVMLDPDTPLDSSQQAAISQRYDNGSLSLLMSEGNSTNNEFLTSQFGASVTGALISDPQSKFTTQSIFSVPLKISSPPVEGLLDFSSPLVISGSTLTPAAYTPSTTMDSKDGTPGPRVVVATAQASSGSRALIITDHNPFTNRFMSPSDPTLNDTGFVGAMVAWVTASGRGSTVVVDNAQYASKAPPFSLGIPVGVIALAALQGAVGSFVGATGSGLGSGGFFGGLLGLVGLSWIAVIINLLIAVWAMRFVRNRLRGVYSEDTVVQDDQPIPKLELAVPAQSKERTDFITMTRKKSFYVATCSQLYDVVDDISKLEFGEGASALGPEKLVPRVGQANVAKTQAMLKELSRIHDYATGEKKRLLPPIFRWKSKVQGLTTQAEAFLNQLGMSMTGQGSAKSVEYALKR